MSGTFNIDNDSIDNHSSLITIMASQMQFTPLFNADNKTTITANNNCKYSYGSSQQSFADVGAALDKEAENIRGLGLMYKQFDDMAKDMVGVPPAQQTIDVPRD